MIGTGFIAINIPVDILKFINHLNNDFIASGPNAAWNIAYCVPNLPILFFMSLFFYKFNNFDNIMYALLFGDFNGIIKAFRERIDIMGFTRLVSNILINKG